MDAMANLRQALYAWRDAEAAKRAVELFRILPGSALDEIVKVLPRTKEELTTIKGIKDAKFQAYGKTILALVEQYAPEGGHRVSPEPERAPDAVSSVGAFLSAPPEVPPYSVSDYLDVVNRTLWRLSARVQGEVTSLKFQGSALYLAIKDAEDESTLQIFMWLSDYTLCGVEIREGMEVVVEGKSEVYKPTGRLSFRAQTIAPVGEGALRAAYEALRKRLETEGLFSLERKRPLPDFPERIGLVTSRDGAVIHDFLNNLGRFGFQISFVDSRVEGLLAVKDLLQAIDRLAREDLDVLVVVRGGGSLESLQAFNNEQVVRALAAFPTPVLCAIGHDKDVPLAQMAADHAPSTPTACTALLNAPWEEATGELRLLERDLRGNMDTLLSSAHVFISDTRVSLSDQLVSLRDLFREAEQGVRIQVPVLARAIEGQLRQVREEFSGLTYRYRSALDTLRSALDRFSAELRLHNPLEQLRFGYSILSRQRKVLRSVDDLSPGDDFEARLSDGTLKASVTEITRE